jgi:hypothetical protein
MSDEGIGILFLAALFGPWILARMIRLVRRKKN